MPLSHSTASLQSSPGLVHNGIDVIVVARSTISAVMISKFGGAAALDMACAQKLCCCRSAKAGPWL